MSVKPPSASLILQQLAEKSGAVFFATDKEGTFVMSQGDDLKRLGLKSGEFIGESIYEKYGQYPEVLKAIEATMNGESYRGVMRLDGPDGDVHYYTSFIPLTSDSGDVVGIGGIAVDITDILEPQQMMKQKVGELQDLREDMDKLKTKGAQTPS